MEPGAPRAPREVHPDVLLITTGRPTQCGSWRPQASRLTGVGGRPGAAHELLIAVHTAQATAATSQISESQEIAYFLRITKSDETGLPAM